jgi:hypothetical protein
MRSCGTLSPTGPSPVQSMPLKLRPACAIVGIDTRMPDCSNGCDQPPADATIHDFTFPVSSVLDDDYE